MSFESLWAYVVLPKPAYFDYIIRDLESIYCINSLSYWSDKKLSPFK